MRIVTLAQASSDEHFVQSTSGPHTGQWICKLCTGRHFKDKIRHSKLRTHIDRVRVQMARLSVAQPAAATPGLASSSLASSASMFPEEEIPAPANMERSPDQNNMNLFGDEMSETSDELESLYDPIDPNDFEVCNLQESREDSVDLDDFLDNSSDVENNPRPMLEPAVAATDTWLPWYPLRKAEHAAALLMLGTGRNLMSTAEYNRLRSILKRVLKVDLPDLSHIKNIRRDLKARLGLRVFERNSPLGNPCFTLSVCDIISQELSNPEVSPHMEFIPEKDVGVTVDRYSQSKKWREDLPQSIRAPMVVVDGQHFYIYEPAQLEDSRVVVPVFFYKDELNLRAKCLEVVPGCQGSHDFMIAEEPKFDSNIFLDVNVQSFAASFLQIELLNGRKWCETPNIQLLQRSGLGLRGIELPNPWRVKANGLIVRSVPIALYSDDTSGNVSKKWNKHMSFYFTLAGLQAASTGFRAYDCSAHQEVLVVPFILCHMGDSPMHAEISNTTNPSGTLSPCRICNLTVESRADKQTEFYIQKFVGIDQEWLPANLPMRMWKRTSEQTRTLFQLTRNPKSIKQFDDLSKEYGIRDSLNLHFAKEIQQIYRSNKNKAKEDQTSQQEIIAYCESLEEKFGDHMFNPFLRLTAFDGHMDTPVESLHVVLLGVTKYLYRDVISKLSPADLVTAHGRWQSFGIEGLNVPPIQPRNMVQYANSLLGKDFRVVLQAAPFVIFDFLTDEYRHCWISLVHLASYIFQTQIFNKHSYITDLKIVVARFLNQLVRLTAQWTNKPKFHMLTHLVLSVDRFGPASLFMTEKMESQNGVMRKASVQSNHHAPGKDISNAFNNERLLRMLISGGFFFDSKLGIRTTASKLMRELFGDKAIRQSLGLHLPLSIDSQDKLKLTYGKGSKSTQPDDDSPPAEIISQWPNAQWKKVTQVILENGQKVIDHADHSESPIKIGRVTAIWQKLSPDLLIFQVKKSKRTGLNTFYGMAEIKETNHQAWIQTDHNCHEGHCAVTNTRTFRIERTEAQKRRPEVTHLPFNSFIINAGCHYSSEYHRSVTNHLWTPVSPTEWQQSITEGLSVWFDRCPPKGLGQNPVDDPVPEEDVGGEILF
ncbi:hypothetical protein DFH28DRAFT_932887 [Melampsora americana]|nr:hypothetical protein DFH28DRAFT_932887 [Melampsora americana]